jgi:uncharacterized NAD(P)/FAD-binding protein YdhS
VIHSSQSEAAPVVAIVGGGASGALLAAQLLRRHHPAGARIVLIERRHEIGRGVAYSTPYEYHRLNVPIEEMGALPRDPRHFLRWASRQETGLVVGDFAPRRLYGEYLVEMLAEAERAAISGVTLERVSDEAVDLVTGRSGVRVELRSGSSVEASRVVLAVGNLPPSRPPGYDPATLASGRYEPDPWDDGICERAAEDESILLLGTGLTMVDVALTLGRECFRPNLLAISRKGLMPRRHRFGVTNYQPTFGPVDDEPALRRVVARVEEEVVAAVRDGGNWRQVIDSMRPVTNQIWMRFSDDDRRLFVERLSRRWDVHRHRMAPAVAAMLAQLESTGRLQIERASIAGIELVEDGVEVTLARGRNETPEPVRFDRVVNCTGPALDLTSAADPLLDALFDRGSIRPGPLRLGLDHDLRGAAVEASGATSRHIYEIGPVRKGRLWETTAIPEIRDQAVELAATIAADLERDHARGKLEPAA